MPAADGRGLGRGIFRVTFEDSDPEDCGTGFITASALQPVSRDVAFE